MNKTVMITGASSGFGKLASKTFASHGWNVFATMRSPEKETELTGMEGIHVARLDVTDADSIAAAMTEARGTFGVIDVLVNNAGYGGHALFEQADMDAIRVMYDTNVFGPMNMMRAVLPAMREKGEGVIVNVSSMAGLFGLPGNGIYSSTKFALNGLSEAMAQDYASLGVRVHIVEPGAYPTTGFNGATDDHLDVGDDQLSKHSNALRQHIEQIGAQMAEVGGSLADPQEVADVIYACATNPDMPVHNPTGSDAQMLTGMIDKADNRQVFIDQMREMLLPKL